MRGALLPIPLLYSLFSISLTMHDLIGRWDHLTGCGAARPSGG